MIFQKNQETYRQVLPGIQMKTLVWGEKTLLAEFHLQAGSSLPRHSHPYEQTGYLVSGRLRMTVGAETYDFGPGDSWCIPVNIEHSAEIPADAVAIEVFSPVREDYLPERPGD